jgi:NAD(P)-dependent dehydrogenase (short-subunit alcohol dehydrogenase family)
VVRTDFSKPFWATPAIHDQIVMAIPAGRIAETADLAPIVLLLASRLSDYITGQTIAVDGGATVI